MDPVIHVGVAVLAGRLATGEQQPRSRGRDALLIATATLGALGPDADVFYEPFPEATGGLGYMLYHRGPTHTVLACLAIGLAIAALVWLAFRKLRPGCPSFRELAIVAVLGTELHLLFDGFVDYGVHPFYPWTNWVFGDFLFLSEPLLWLVLVPPLAAWLVSLLSLRHAGWRALLIAAPGVAAIAWTWYQAFQPLWVLKGAAAVVTVWGALFLFVYRRDRSPRVAAAGLLLVCVVFFAASRRARSMALEQLGPSSPGEQLRHVITTATAANPLCWRIITSGYRDDGKTVVVRIGSLSLLPELSDAASCVISNRHPPPSAPVVWSPGNDRAFNWFGVFQAPTSTFFELGTNDCRAKATRHFLRAPFWKSDNGSAIIGDLRLDYFADPHKWAKYTFDPKEIHACSSLREPIWTPPFFDSNQ